MEPFKAFILSFWLTTEKWSDFIKLRYKLAKLDVPMEMIIHRVLIYSSALRLKIMETEEESELWTLQALKDQNSLASTKTHNMKALLLTKVCTISSK